MIRQQQALIATEGVDLIFTEPAIRRISEVAEEVNTLVDNIGARRLHTILERILEEISFNAPEQVGPLSHSRPLPMHRGIRPAGHSLHGVFFRTAACQREHWTSPNLTGPDAGMELTDHLMTVPHM